MGRFSKKLKKGEEKPPEEAAPTLPTAQSETHITLLAERETAASAHRRAEKAEAAYRARKRATIARSEYAAAKTHMKTSWKEGYAGVKSTVKCAGLSHAILLEKVRNAENKNEKKALERSKSKREKMSEKMKKMEEEEEKRRKEVPAEAAAAAA